MAALALVMAACSNDDNDTPNINPAEAGVVHFSATLPAPNSSATTRTEYTEDAGTINVAWKDGDKIALCHNGTKDVITLTPSDINSDGSVTISAYITATNGEDVTVAYPAERVVKVSGATAVFGGNNWEAQDGTLDYIATNLDTRCGTGTFSVSGDKASFQSDITVNAAEFSIWKLTLTDGTNALNATQVTLKKGSISPATIAKATSTAKSVYYMAVSPNLLSAYDGTFAIEATVGSDTYTYSRSSLTLDAGNYYQSTVTMTKVPTLADATVGMIVGTDGKPYDVAPTGVTAAGMVAYKSGANGLVIALRDDGNYWSWTNAETESASHTPSVTGQTWKLPSMDEWKNMLTGNDTDGWSSVNLNTALENAGGTALGADYHYWTSTQDGEYPQYYYLGFTNNTGTFKSKLSSGEAHARACFAF